MTDEPHLPDGGCTVRTEGNKEDKLFELPGGEGVFDGVTDFAHTPCDARVLIASGAGSRFALAGAKCERRLPARYGPAPEVSVIGCARRRTGGWAVRIGGRVVET